ncbi:hypothetical protein L249_7279 [Ophiocordyceps polyrhachis-furcata BCC 54312]|uniref:Uncharacterized protein n=1 Tax=Ophiocordyceps polyrhachis-furcata BCC 54312 TaxID=1330021 RepID=A0A367LAS1_9HYPO|nr:hypothetical protein L249_7279 [Ophiocordyceps polyrhachis-furcata BCC 54312]
MISTANLKPRRYLIIALISRTTHLSTRRWRRTRRDTLRARLGGGKDAHSKENQSTKCLDARGGCAISRG